MKTDGVFDIFRCSERLAQATRHARQPILLPKSSIANIGEKCSSAIIRLVEALTLFPNNFNQNKLFAHVVGLLYVMRQGITCNDTALLVHLPILSYILPQENHIHAVFKVRSKVITETENMVKMAMRNLSLHALITKHYSTA